MNSTLSLSEVCFSAEKTENYAIYGTGEIGRMLERVLKLLNQRVTRFLCSNGYKKEEEIEGIKVYEIAEYEPLEGEKILMTVSGGVLAILDYLSRNVDAPVIQVNSRQDIYKVYHFFYHNYFKGTDSDTQYLTLGNCCFLNPFKEDISYALPFFMECGDLILPAIYDDLSCIFEGPYELAPVALEKGDIVFDCGSNIGLFSIIASETADKVFAFEPMYNAYSYFEKNVKEKANIELCKYAVGDYTGKVMFEMNAELSAAGGIAGKKTDAAKENSRQCEVDITTIDEFVEKYNVQKVDFIKADIEGAERDLLKGAYKTLQKYGPKLAICEYHLPDDPKVLEELIKAANPDYVVIHKYKKIYAYIP